MEVCGGGSNDGPPITRTHSLMSALGRKQTLPDGGRGHAEREYSYNEPHAQQRYSLFLVGSIRV